MPLLDPSAPATIVSTDRLTTEPLKPVKIVVENVLRAMATIYVQIARVLNNEEMAAWTALTLSNSWVMVGGAYQSARYRKAWGLVELQGYVKDGSATTVATLPVGYRPTASHLFGVGGAGGGATIVVASDGTVVANTSGAGVQVSLSGIRFRAEA